MKIDVATFDEKIHRDATVAEVSAITRYEGKGDRVRDIDAQIAELLKQQEEYAFLRDRLSPTLPAKDYFMSGGTWRIVK